jgi:hypothetical protein
VADGGTQSSLTGQHVTPLNTAPAAPGDHDMHQATVITLLTAVPLRMFSLPHRGSTRCDLLTPTAGTDLSAGRRGHPAHAHPGCTCSALPSPAQPYLALLSLT